ncbi:MAG TPA: hypothetical protein VER33_26780 [Polyangiaceae bacterium]|nr:hypothetical protein [Polyangiaceae bacterium]
MKASPTASGKVVFAFTNRRDASVGGIVESVELIEGTTLGDPEFDLCVRESLLSLRLRPPKNGGVVTVTYPVDFSPEPAPEQPAGGRGGAAAK